MLKKSGAALVLLVFLAGLPAMARAGSENSVFTCVTAAKTRITENNIQQAKQHSVSSALDMALQNAFASLVSRPVFAAGLDFFYGKIIPRARDYIIAYRVLGGIEDNGFYLTAVESRVDMNLLEKTLIDARVLNAHKDKPVILFFIAEQTSGDVLPRYWWGHNPEPYKSDAERIIIEKMIKNRFDVIGAGSDRPDPAFYNINFNSIYDIDAAENLGRQMKADMIVLGRANASEAINRMGEEKTFNAQITLEAYNLETGEKAVVSRVQAVVKSESVQTGNHLALVKAAELSGSDLIEKIDAYWSNNLRKEHSFDLKIQGDNFLARYIALKQRLKQMPGIENMQPKEIGTDYAVLQIFYKGRPAQFADAVMLKTFEGFGLEISDVSDDLVSVKFIEKSSGPVMDENQNTLEDQDIKQ